MKAQFLFILLVTSISIHSQIRIILTVALTDTHYEFRKNEYVQAMQALKSFGYADFYIVEALKKEGPTFLEEYCNNVYYASNNDPYCLNQGINESKTMLEALNHFKFDPEDIVIKLTGRHRLISDHFIQQVNNHQEYDVFIKSCYGFMPHWADGMVLTMCFAIRCKYLMEMYEQMDYKTMREENIPLEWQVPLYLLQKSAESNIKIYNFEKLDIRVNAFASSASPGQEEKIFIF